MSTPPHVSVIIPAFNAAHTITGTLRSVAGQSLGMENLELIIVNDGSTDQTGPVAEAFLRETSVLWRVIDIHNSGPSRARNIGLREATGEWIQLPHAGQYCGPGLGRN